MSGKLPFKRIFGFVKLLNQRYKTHNLTAFAGQMAYFFVLSFFPLLIFLLSIISKLKINYDYAMEIFERFIPDNISLMIADFISQTISTEGVAVLSISGVLMLYSASRAVNALQRSINMSYEVTETRNFFMVKLMGMFYTLMFTLIIVLSLMVPTVFQSVFQFLNTMITIKIDSYWLDLAHFLRNILLMSSFVIVILSIYAFLPNKKMHLADILPGAIFSIFGSISTNFVFSKIVGELTDYSILYGSLSAVIAFMVWVYFLSLIIIIGAEINAIHYLKVKQ
ncbi:YihY/virulence factor BrkB family protein [Fusibacter bizertensis]|uniref:YihY/virulence factor BrkB family protein n=1 Tax=Fusibacter bizertensis TaxID=1488331 RepID=A0ABT6NB25_9FIRM|nr:YihY/virulence factor BrkB family protein [Fusibacter bizertensis]MDH8677609.1 YihY/virulence factor BrkB family protein [Fusibacter bizertensis]